MLHEIESQIKMSLTENEDILAIIKESKKKIHYDEGHQRFSLKSLYPIFDRVSLIETLMKSPQGIPENQDLFDCYKGIEKDIQHLKEANNLRIIYNPDKDKRFNVLFYKNPADSVENSIQPVEPFLRDLWRSITNRDFYDRNRVIEEVTKKRRAV